MTQQLCLLKIILIDQIVPNGIPGRTAQIEYTNKLMGDQIQIGVCAKHNILYMHNIYICIHTIVPTAYRVSLSYLWSIAELRGK